MQQEQYFKGYSKIENHYQENFISKLLDRENNSNKGEQTEMDFSNKLEWVCLEKVHGSNFSFIIVPKQDGTDQVEVLKANRTNILTIFSSFYVEAQKEVYERYYKNCVKLYELIKENGSKYKRKAMESDTITKVHIFGELFGGHFPKLKTQQDSTDIRKPHIQKGVYYCPHYDFYAFDVALSFGDQDSWLLFDEADPLLEEAGFRVRAKPLFRGSLRECLDFDVEFNTTIPQMFFPELLSENEISFKEKENICEGVVIKPANGSIFVGSRAIIKKKNAKFTEVNPPKDKSQRKSKKEKITDLDETQMISNVWNDIERYLTNNRLDNVVSKLGSITRENLPAVMKNFVNDAIEDFNKDQEQVHTDETVETLPGEGLSNSDISTSFSLDSLPTGVQKAIKKKLGTTSRAIVLKYMMNNATQEEH